MAPLYSPIHIHLHYVQIFTRWPCIFRLPKLILLDTLIFFLYSIFNRSYLLQNFKPSIKFHLRKLIVSRERPKIGRFALYYESCGRACQIAFLIYAIQRFLAKSFVFIWSEKNAISTLHVRCWHRAYKLLHHYYGLLYRGEVVSVCFFWQWFQAKSLMSRLWIP